MQEYRVLNWHEEVGDGINQAVVAALQAYAKRNNENSPYLVVNELIAGGIGQYLRVPVAPHCVARRGDELQFISLSFNLTGEELPPIDPLRVVQEFPHEAAGIVVLDAYIGNYDRHRKNISATLESEPHQLNIYDHDRCLFGHVPGQGEQRLKYAQTSLVIDGSLGERVHCLVPHISDAGRFVEWLTRIEEMPPWFITELCKDAGTCGSVSREEVSAVEEFLLERKDALRDLLKKALQNGPFSALDNQRGLI